MIYHAALETSVELAEKYGAYETFDGSPASRGELQFNLWGVDDENTFSRRCNSMMVKISNRNMTINRNTDMIGKDSESKSSDMDNEIHYLLPQCQQLQQVKS